MSFVFEERDEAVDDELGVSVETAGGGAVLAGGLKDVGEHGESAGGGGGDKARAEIDSAEMLGDGVGDILD